MGKSPVSRWWSEWHNPAVSNRTVTSPGRGSPISISSITQGSLISQIRAPLVFNAEAS